MSLYFIRIKGKMNHKATFLIFTLIRQIYFWTCRKIKFNINIFLKLKYNVSL